MDRRTKIVAEVCCNHMGSFETAKKMIDELSYFPDEFRIDVIKFQKRKPSKILTVEEYNAPHPNPKNAYGNTYGEHREYLEFSIDEHRELKKYCEDKGFIYSSSVFDFDSAREILSLKPKMIKISSANNNDYELLKYIDENFDGEIHVSLGMTTKEEESKIFDSIVKNRKNMVFYACTSAYPVADEDVCLLEIKRLKEVYGDEIKAVGFSGHHIGNVHDISAVTLGAEYIERHYTLDKNSKGTDHFFSLVPSEFLELSKAVRSVEKGLCYKQSDILDSESDIRRRLKFKGR